MAAQNRLRVAVNGYGVIGKRVADAVALQEDMTLTGVVDIVSDWRARAAAQIGMPLYAATGLAADNMRTAGLQVLGTLEDVLPQIDVIVDCTPKRIAASNVETYRQRGVKFIVHGGEKQRPARSCGARQTRGKAT